MDVKKTLGLLNGISKRMYYNESIENDYLHEQILPNSSIAEFEQIVDKYSSLLQDIVINDVDVNDLGIKLKQMQENNQLSPDECNGITKFWKVNRIKLHDVLIQQSLWEDKLKSFSWRIDVSAQSKSIDKINKPTAIVELKSKSRLHDQGSDSVLFEMDQEQVQKLLAGISDIEETITKYSQP
ncbi:COMM domain-containing protein 1 [Trichoplax sp. H2]|uniref:COMM domain-containing protein 1 n=1 Tax=Trichoplax adhaerens TaxID=10228 RepID=B3SDD0_TRIAD|nr:expressed hypothetical protein [Trichoplax adhaerens]EDV19248.1 expressed hypothetical protein [Trichoplax adhaerens]RDD37651.1 COMM domain-containing protein 1 [Trichoplax sp. H2]|eukprot:XP_002118245.1 expressed hypothetical protein [Trichoplax adhaerens]